MQIPVQTCVKGNMITGMLHVPAIRAKGTPVIIMCYGLNGDRVEIHRMSVIAARQAEEMGVVFLRFDYRGLGLSEGEFWSSSLESKTEDVLAMIDFVKGCFQMETTTLILLGFCDGGRIASRIAALRDDINGLIMWNPIFSALPAVFRSQGSEVRLMREPKTKEFVYPFFGLWMGTNYLREINTIMEMEELHGFKKPKLLIFAENDSYTRETRSSDFMDAFVKDPLIELLIIKNAKHLFNSINWTKQVIDNSLNWSINLAKSNV